MTKEIKEYDNNGNLSVFYKNSEGFDYCKKYDKNNNQIYYKNSSGEEYFWEYDKNGNEIYYKSSNGTEYFWKYDENNKQIKITKQEYKEIEFRVKEKEYNSRKKVSRFELMII